MNTRAEQLIKRFGGTTALDGVSLDIAPGEIMAVLGPNGAGKTTLLHALAGVIPLDGGQVLFDGQPFTPGRGDLRRRFAFLPDPPPVPAHWTPLRFIATALKLYETPDTGLEEKIEDLLARLDLLPVARWAFGRLSRGQIYKAVLAAFLAADPELWLVDEPFASGMDPRGLNCFKEYAKSAIPRGRSIVFTTQIVEVAEPWATRICILDKGRVQACASPAELRGNGTLAGLFAGPGERPGA